MANERWLPIPGYVNAYEVSDLGKVKSIPRVVTRSNGRFYTVKGGDKAATPGGPYPIVTLKMRGSRKTFRIHVLVMRAFVGECPEGLQVCHRDGNSYNNCLRNLRYGTPKSNHADRKRHGRGNEGSRHGNSKLTEERVLALREERKTTKATYKELSLKYGVNPYQIGRIVRREIWTHV